MPSAGRPNGQDQEWELVLVFPSSRSPETPRSSEQAGAEPPLFAEEELSTARVIFEGLIQSALGHAVSEICKLPINSEPVDIDSATVSRALTAFKDAMPAENEEMNDRARRFLELSVDRARAQVSLPRNEPEKELEDFLVRNLDRIDFPKAGEPRLTYEDRQVATRSGVIDIAAKRGEQPVTIELKARDFNVTATVQQLTKYLKDRSDDHVIFVAPAIPATLHFNLKEFVDAGRLSYVTVRGRKGDYTFKPFDPTTFTAEQMAKAQQWYQRSPGSEADSEGEFITLLSEREPRRSQPPAGGRGAPPAAQPEGGTTPGAPAGTPGKAIPAQLPESVSESHDLSSATAPAQGSDLRREVTEQSKKSETSPTLETTKPAEPAETTETTEAGKKSEVDLFPRPASLEERKSVLANPENWPREDTALYDPTLAARRLLLVGLIMELKGATGELDAHEQSEWAQVIGAINKDALQHLGVKVHSNGSNPLNEVLRPALRGVGVNAPHLPPSGAEKLEQDLRQLLDETMKQTRSRRTSGLNNLQPQSNAAEIYNNGLTEILKPRQDEALSDWATRISVAEDTLFEAIAEVLSNGSAGRTKPSYSPLALQARVSTLLKLRSDIAWGSLPDSEHTRAISALKREEAALSNATGHQLCQLAEALLSFNLPPSRASAPDAFRKMVKADQIIEKHSPELAFGFLSSELALRMDQCSIVRSRRLKEVQSASAGQNSGRRETPYAIRATINEVVYGRDVRADEDSLRRELPDAIKATINELVYRREVRLVEALAKVDKELAVQYALSMIRLSSNFNPHDPITLWGAEHGEHLVEQLRQAHPLAGKSSGALSGAEICSHLKITGKPLVTAAVLAKNGYQRQLEEVVKHRARAFESVEGLDNSTPSNPSPHSKSNRSHRNSSPIKPLLAHEVSDALERDLCSAIGALKGNDLERALSQLGSLADGHKANAHPNGEKSLSTNNPDDPFQKSRLPATPGLYSRSGHAALRDVLSYRRAAARLLAEVDPDAARAYLRFTLKSVEQVIPAELQSLRKDAPSITAAIQSGDRSTAAELKLYLELDRKVFEHLLDEAQRRAPEQRSSVSQIQRIESPAPETPFKKLSRNLLDSLGAGPVYDAAQGFLKACEEKALEDSALKSMAEEMRRLGLGKLLDRQNGLSTSQAASFLKALTASISKGIAPTPDSIRSAYELAKLQLRGNSPP